jgi:hypothetical protein
MYFNTSFYVLNTLERKLGFLLILLIVYPKLGVVWLFCSVTSFTKQGRIIEVPSKNISYALDVFTYHLNGNIIVHVCN